MTKKYIDFTRLIADLYAKLPSMLGDSSETLVVSVEGDMLCIRVKIQKLGCLQRYHKDELNRFYNEIGEGPNIYLLYHFKKYFEETQLKYGLPDIEVKY